ncbi:hypothetical protein [Rhizobium leguminosarum]|uniref:hypothetical protein n=1 Tax=Rhizobium leguminosarum TaxID=384 RepID=UPI002E12FFE7|nr:hypothetical protein U8Q02_41910 [Rhizobium leguminosarum]
MTEEKTLTYYARKGQPLDVAAFVSIREQVDGNVHFHNAWGGPGYYASETNFAEDFDQVPAAEIDRIFRTYRTIRVTCDDGATFMTGYTNGHLWNGFESPSFTKEEVLAHLQPGGHLAPSEYMAQNRFVWSDLADTFILLEGIDGAGLPEVVDIAPFETLLVEGRDDEADAIAEEMGMEVSLAHKFTVVPEGAAAPVALFVIDNGWCWGNMDDYDPEVDEEMAVDGDQQEVPSIGL